VNEAPLSQLLCLAASEASGELVCEAGGVEVHVFLQSGRIAWATDSRYPRAFTEYLKEHLGLDSETFERAIAEARRSQTPIGETLVAFQAATLEQVQTGLRHQIGLAVAALGQSLAGAHAVFLPRPQYSKRVVQFTFAIEEFFPGAVGQPATDTVSSSPPAVQTGGVGGAPEVGSQASDASAASSAARPGTPDIPARGQRLPRVVIGGAVAALLTGAVVVGASRHGSRTPGTGGVTAAAAAAAAEQPPAAGGSPGELAFGMSAPFSGPLNDLGNAMRTGVGIAFALANETGGIHGRQLRLLALDDQHDPSRTVEVMRELVENRKVFGIVGNVGTAGATAALQYAIEKQVIVFGALTGSELAHKNPPEHYVFNYRPSLAKETAAAVRYLVEVRRIQPSQIAVFYQDDEMGQAALAGVREEMHALKQDAARLVHVTYKRNTADVSAAVSEISKQRAQVRAVVLIASSQAALQLIQQVKDLGLDLVFTNVSEVDASVLAEGLVSAGAGYASGVVVTQVVPLPGSKASAALEYQAALAKYAVGEKPDFVSFEGFIVGRLLVEALRRTGKDLTTEALVSTLERIRGLDLGTGAPINFGSGDHQGSQKIWGTELQPDGSYRAIRLE
jgi:ABC-type branched-subunit amino acid transport system substrate-binding protein